MADAKASGSCGCFTFAMLMFLLFLGLKLGQVGEVADWSYVWVTAPLWIYAVCVGLLLLIVGAAAVVVAAVGTE